MANTKVTGDLLADGTLFARHLNESHGITTSVIGEGTNLFYTDTRVGTYLGTYLPANGYDTATNIIASIVDSAPVTLDTLNELAAALGDDPNFATTVTTAIATKIDGTGTASYLMKWSDSNTAANSVIYDDGTNIGIGVTPSGTYGKLTVNGSVRLLNDQNTKLEIGRYSVGTPNSYIKLGSNSNSLRITNNNDTADLVFIQNGGGVRIGIDTDAVFGEQLTINGDILLSDGSFGSGDKFTIMLGDANAFMQSEHGQKVLFGAYNGFKFSRAISNNKTTSTDWMTITDAGNVGIGTTLPNAKLSVFANGLSPHASPTGISVSAGTGGANLLARDGDFHNWLPFTDGANYYSANAHTIRNSTHNIDFAYIEDANFVVNGRFSWSNGVSSIISNQLQSGYNNAGDDSDFWINYTGYQGGASYFRDFRIGNGKQGLIAFFDGSTSRVGIGTALPTQLLHVSGYARLNGYQVWGTEDTISAFVGYEKAWTGIGSSNNLAISAEGGNGISFFTNGNTSNRMFINTSGQVGIGRTSMDEALHVNGNIKGDYGIFDGEGLSTDLRVGGIHGNLGLYVSNTYDMQFDLGWSGLFKFTVTNIARLTISSSGTVTALGDFVPYSDARVKENIETIDNALDKVIALRGVSYNRTDIDDKTKKIGLIAQEVREILPEVVQEQDNGMLGVAYGNIVGLLIEAMKELKAENDALKSRIETLEQA